MAVTVDRKDRNWYFTSKLHQKPSSKNKEGSRTIRKGCFKIESFSLVRLDVFQSACLPLSSSSPPDNIYVCVMSEIDDRDYYEKVQPLLPKNIYFYTAIASFSSFVYGYNMAIIAPALLFLPLRSPLWTSSIVSITLLGAAVGSLLSGPFIDGFGRRISMIAPNIAIILGVGLSSVSVLGESSTKLRIVLIMSRFILGLAVGMAAIVPALYITEMAPAQIRGKMGAINQLSGAIAMVAAFLFGYLAVLWTLPSRAASLMFASGLLPAMLQCLLATVILPETPRWLVEHNQKQKAITVLTKIYGPKNETSIMQQYQMLANRRNQGADRTSCCSWGELLQGTNRRPVLISLALQILQHMSFYSVLFYYGTSILLAHNQENERTALLYNAVSAIPQLLIMVGTIFFLDRWGRKPALLISTAGVAISLVVIGISFQNGSPDSRWPFWLLVAGIVGHRAFFSFGLGPVPSILTAEILPFRIRARGLSAALFLNWSLNLIITIGFPFLHGYVTKMQYIFWTLALLTFAAIPVTVTFLHETSGNHLDIIEVEPTSKIV